MAVCLCVMCGVFEIVSFLYAFAKSDWIQLWRCLLGYFLFILYITLYYLGFGVLDFDQSKLV